MFERKTVEMSKLLDIRNLSVHFKMNSGLVRAVDDVSFSVGRGETVALVGESGCGKSVTSLAVMRLLPQPPAVYAGGSITLYDDNGAPTDLLSLPEDNMRSVRGDRVAMIFQEPMTSLNPVFTVGDQISEAVRLHQDISKSKALDRAAEMLELVGIPEPRRRLGNYPHEMSGGMRQRVMIAMALSCTPDLIIADEPTTALDVTIQAQILELMADLQKELGMAVLFITHDLGVVAEIADRVIVMYAGQVVEDSDAVTVLKHPRHPYTMGLLQSIPRADAMRSLATRLSTIEGTVPDAARLPDGCLFHPRCRYRDDSVCIPQKPLLENMTESHAVRCLRLDAVREEREAHA